MNSRSETERSGLLDDEFLAKLKSLQLVSKNLASGRLRGERRSRRRGFSTEFADYRDYTAGDDLRYLDWNIFGRLDRLFVKLFHEEEELDVELLVDRSTSMVAGDPPKARIGLQIAAALGVIALSNGDRVTLTPFGSEVQPADRPFRGRGSLPRLFRALESLEFDDHTQVAHSLRHSKASTPRRGIAVLISDLLDPNGIDGALRALSYRARETYLVHILSPQEIDPEKDDEFEGDLILEDSEVDARVDVTVTPRMLEAYSRTVAAFRAEIDEIARRRNITVVAATSDLPFERWVLDLLRKRNLVR